MGNSHADWTCCKYKTQNNLSDEYEIKKPDVQGRYPPAKNDSESSVVLEKGHVEEISSIEFIPYSEDLPIKDVSSQPEVQKHQESTLPLSMRDENNTEAIFFIQTHSLATQLKTVLTTSEQRS